MTVIGQYWRRSISARFIGHLVFGLVVTTAPLTVATTARADDFGKVTTADRNAATNIYRLLQSQHLLQPTIDDSISERALAHFVKGLDAQKMYFTKADIAEFDLLKHSFDDELKKGSYQHAFTIFKRFLDRVDQSTVLINELLDQQHDFTVDEEMVTDRDLIDYAVDDADMRERWRKRIKYSILVMKGDETIKDAPADRLRRRYKTFATRMHQTGNEDVVEMFISSITTSLDPHTTYMSPTSFQSLMIQLELNLEGIGATLQGDDDGYTVIKRIVPNGPADKQGDLKVEDRLFAVGQGDGTETVEVMGMRVDDVVKMIRGKAGTVVRLSVLSPNNETKTIRIVRESVQLDDEAARGKIFEEGQRPDGQPYKVGYIELPSFYSDTDSDSPNARRTTTDVDRILKDFTKEGVDAVVLDLRENGGGSLREAIECTGLFIDYGPVVQVKDAFGQTLQHNDPNRTISWDKPLVVLTSKLSASASEILAGAIKDYGRGLVVGDTTTHGKGTVQSLVDLNQIFFSRNENSPKLFGALKLTMQQFYRPNGDSTQKRGVFADIVLPSIFDKMDISESDLDFPVEFDKIPKAQFRSVNQVTPELISKLAAKSAERVKADEEFSREIRRIAKYEEFKKRTSVTLNEEKFVAERKEFDAEKEDAKTIEAQANRSKAEIKRTYYLNEVFKITEDYLKEIGSAG